MLSELDVQNTIRIEGAMHGLRLWRNNSGALTDVGGRLVRFGLGNDSARTNEVCKSSDLIGLGPDGVFVAIECKREGWKYKGSGRELAQRNFINIVAADGGIACFATRWQDVYEHFSLCGVQLFRKD